MSCPPECKGLPSSGSCKKDQSCNCASGSGSYSSSGSKPTFLGCVVGCFKWSDYFRYERIADYLHIPRGIEVKWGDVPGNRPYDDDLGSYGRSCHTYYSGSGDPSKSASVPGCSPCASKRRPKNRQNKETTITPKDAPLSKSDPTSAKEPAPVECDYVPPELKECHYEAALAAERREAKKRSHHHRGSKDIQNYMVYSTSTLKKKDERKAIEPALSDKAKTTPKKPPSVPSIGYQPSYAESNGQDSLYSQGPQPSQYEESLDYLPLDVGPGGEMLYYPQVNQPLQSVDTIDYQTADEGGSFYSQPPEPSRLLAQPVMSARVFEYSPTETEPDEGGSYYTQGSQPSGSENVMDDEMGPSYLAQSPLPSQTFEYPSADESQDRMRNAKKKDAKRDDPAMAVPAYAVREITRRYMEAARKHGQQQQMRATGHVASEQLAARREPTIWEGQHGNVGFFRATVKGPNGNERGVTVRRHPLNTIHSYNMLDQPVQDTRRPPPNTRPSPKQSLTQQVDAQRVLTRQPAGEQLQSANLQPTSVPLKTWQSLNQQPLVYRQTVANQIPYQQPTSRTSPISQTSSQQLSNHRSNSGQSLDQPSISRQSSGQSTNVASPSQNSILRKSPPNRSLIYHQSTGGRMPYQQSMSQHSSGHSTNAQSPSQDSIPRRSPNHPLIYQQSSSGQMPYQQSVSRQSSGHSTNAQSPSQDSILRQGPNRTLIYHQKSPGRMPYQQSVSQHSSGHSTNVQSPSQDSIPRQSPNQTRIHHQTRPGRMPYQPSINRHGQPTCVQSPNQNSMTPQTPNHPLVYRQSNVGQSPFQQSVQSQSAGRGNSANNGELHRRINHMGIPRERVSQGGLSKSPSFDEYEGMSAKEERKIVHFLRRLLSLPRVDSVHIGDDEDTDIVGKTNEQVVMLTQELKKRLKSPPDSPTAGTYAPTRDKEKANFEVNQETLPQFEETNVQSDAETRYEQPKQTRGSEGYMSDNISNNGGNQQPKQARGGEGYMSDHSNIDGGSQQLKETRSGEGYMSDHRCMDGGSQQLKETRSGANYNMSDHSNIDGGSQQPKRVSLSRKNSVVFDMENSSSEQKLDAPTRSVLRSSAHSSTRSKSKSSVKSTSKHERLDASPTVDSTLSQSAASIESSASVKTKKTASGRTLTQSAVSPGIVSTASSNGSFRTGHRAKPKRAPSPDDIVGVVVSPVYVAALPARRTTSVPRSDTGSSSPNPTSDEERFTSSLKSSGHTFDAKRPLSKPRLPSPSPDRGRDKRKEARRRKYSFSPITKSLDLDREDARKKRGNSKSPDSSPVVLDMNGPELELRTDVLSESRAELPHHQPSSGNVLDLTQPESNEKLNMSSSQSVKSTSSSRRFGSPKVQTAIKRNPSLQENYTSPSRQSVRSLASRQNLVTPVKVIKPQLGTLYSPHKYIIARPVTFTTNVPEHDVRFISNTSRVSRLSSTPSTQADRSREVTRLYENNRAQQSVSSSHGSTTPCRETTTTATNTTTDGEESDDSSLTVIREESFVATSVPLETDATEIIHFFERHDQTEESDETASHQNQVDASPYAGQFSEDRQNIQALHLNVISEETLDEGDALGEFADEEIFVATSAPLRTDAAKISRFFERHERPNHGQKNQASASSHQSQGNASRSEWRIPPVLSLNVIPEESQMYLAVENVSSETVNVIDASDTSLVMNGNDSSIVRESTDEEETYPSLYYLTTRIMELENQIQRLEDAFINQPGGNPNIASDNNGKSVEPEECSPKEQLAAADNGRLPTQSEGEENPPILVSNQSSLFSFINSLGSPDMNTGEREFVPKVDGCGMTYSSIDQESYTKMCCKENESSLTNVVLKTGSKRKLPSDDSETTEKKSLKKDPSRTPVRGGNSKRVFKRPSNSSPRVAAKSGAHPFSQVNTVGHVTTASRRVNFHSPPPPTTLNMKNKEKKPAECPSHEKSGPHDRQVYCLYSILTTGTLPSRALLHQLGHKKTSNACKPPTIESEDDWNGAEQKFDVRNLKRESSLDSRNKKLLEDIIGLGKEDTKSLHSWSFNVPLLTLVNQNGNFYDDSSEDSEPERTRFYNESESATARDQARIMRELEKQRLELVEMKQLLSECVACLDTAKRQDNPAPPPGSIQASRWQTRQNAKHSHGVVRSGSCSYRSGKERPMLSSQLRALSDLSDRKSNQTYESDCYARGLMPVTVAWQESKSNELPTSGEHYERCSFSRSFIERLMSFFNPRGYARHMRQRELLREQNNIENSHFQSIACPSKSSNTRSKLICYNANVKSNSLFNSTGSRKFNNEPVSSQEVQFVPKRENAKLSGCCAWLRFCTSCRHQDSQTSSRQTFLAADSKDLSSNSKRNCGTKSSHRNPDSSENNFSSEVFVSQAMLESMATPTTSQQPSSRERDPVEPRWRNERLGTKLPDASLTVSPVEVNHQEDRRLQEAFLNNRPSFTYSVNVGSASPAFVSDSHHAGSDPTHHKQDSSEAGPAHRNKDAANPVGQACIVHDSSDHTSARNFLSKRLSKDNTAQSGKETQNKGVLLKRLNAAMKKGEHDGSEEKPRTGLMHSNSKGSNHDGDEKKKSSQRFNILMKRDSGAHPGEKTQSKGSFFNRSSTSDRPERKQSISQRLGGLVSRVSKPQSKERSQSRKSGFKLPSVFTKKGEHENSAKKERRPTRNVHSTDDSRGIRKSLSQRFGGVMNRVNSPKSKERLQSKRSVSHRPSVSKGEHEDSEENAGRSSTTNAHSDEGTRGGPVRKKISKRLSELMPKLSETVRGRRMSGKQGGSASANKHEDPGELQTRDSVGSHGSKKDACVHAEHRTSLSQPHVGPTDTDGQTKGRRPLVRKPDMHRLTNKFSRTKSAEEGAEGSGTWSDRILRKKSSVKSGGSSHSRRKGGGTEGKKERSKLFKLCRHYLCACLLH